MVTKNGFAISDNDRRLIRDHTLLIREALFSCTTETQVECAVGFARYLNRVGLNGENFWLFLRLLMTNNPWVIDELLHDREAGLLFSTICPDAELIEVAFQILFSRHPDELYPRALEAVLGIIQSAYFDPDDGYRIRRLSVMDINALGKFLHKDLPQDQPLNRLILDILDKIAHIGDYYGEPDKNVLSKHAFNVRFAYFDRTREMVDAIPVYLAADESADFKITAKQLGTVLKTLKKPKVLILNSPNNPTGAVYTRTELEAIANVCIKHDLLVISDEIYEKLIYDGEEHFSIAQVSDEIKQRTIVINGVSKAFAMTGWRMGYAAGPIDIIKAATRLQGHTTSCVTSITQMASVTALIEDDGSIENMRQEFDRRRKFLVEEINRIPHVSCSLPKGAFYTMANVGYYIKNNCKGINNTDDLCIYLLENAHIAVVTGTAFGMENYVRFSYANSLENLKTGMVRFKDGLLSLCSDPL